MIDIPNFFIAASAMQALVLSVFLLLPPNFEKTNNRLLAVVLLSVAAQCIELFLYGVGLTLRHPNFAYIGTLLSILQPPAIYLYTKSLMYREFEIKLRHGVHILPFLLTAIVFFFGYYLQPYSIKLQMIQQQDLPGMPTSLWLALLIHGIFLFYLLYAIKVLRDFSIGVKNIFSEVDSKQISWLKILLLGYVVVWSFSLAYCLSFYIYKRSAETQYVLLFGGAAEFLFINILVVYALKQSALFSGLTKEESELLRDEAVLNEVITPSDEKKQRIEAFLINQKPFLNPNLSIHQLAKQIGIPTRELSFVINSGFGKNFFDFVGDYRISHAKHLLESEGLKKSILEVMYESGFNSKSVFNTAFKEKTGVTPSQYKKGFHNSQSDELKGESL